VKLAFLRGILSSPVPVWLDEKNKYFADVGWISVMPAGFEANAKAMRDAAGSDRRRRGEVRRQALPHRCGARAGAVRQRALFDADKGVFLDNQAVLASDGKIAAIGAAGSLSVPAGTRTIDGRGKTLVPGIWDSHMHIGDDWDVLANVANGITSFRSPGTMIDRASRRPSAALRASC
jgi:urease alpha subunit